MLMFQMERQVLGKLVQSTNYTKMEISKKGREMSRSNSCKYNIGRYHEDQRMPSASDSTVSLSISNMQICLKKLPKIAVCPYSEDGMNQCNILASEEE